MKAGDNYLDLMDDLYRKPQPEYNPQAFPGSMSDQYLGTVPTQGMTLLDYFAGQAMQALIERNASEVIENAYDYAERMLEERNKRLNKPEGGER